jgi:hypothetical protein
VTGTAAVISDVHGNLPALEAALARIDELGVDDVDALAVARDMRAAGLPAAGVRPLRSEPAAALL